MAQPIPKTDFLGPYLLLSEAVYRPTILRGTGVKEIKQAATVSFSPEAIVTFVDGTQEGWLDCGCATAYLEARHTLTKLAFEEFVCMATAFAIIPSGSAAMRSYPPVAALFPGGVIDHGSGAVRAHVDLAKALRRKVYDARKSKDDLQAALLARAISDGKRRKARVAASKRSARAKGGTAGAVQYV